MKRNDSGKKIDQVKINKVNEMDIKVSRFDKGEKSARVEEIPSEEPLIQIR